MRKQKASVCLCLETKNKIAISLYESLDCADAIVQKMMQKDLMNDGDYVDEIAKIDLSSDELYSSFMNMFAKWIGKTDEIYYSDKITVIEQHVNFDILKGKYRIESIGNDWIFQGVVDIASDKQLYQYVRKYNLNIG